MTVLVLHPTLGTNCAPHDVLGAPTAFYPRAGITRRVDVEYCLQRFEDCHCGFIWRRVLDVTVLRFAGWLVGCLCLRIEGDIGLWPESVSLYIVQWWVGVRFNFIRWEMNPFK